MCEKTIVVPSICAISLAVLLVLLVACSEAPDSAPEAASGDIGPWTDTNYPSYVKHITHFGQRADWSPDKNIFFMEKTYGDVYEVELETGVHEQKTRSSPD
jgi:hypothetical protein